MLSTAKHVISMCAHAQGGHQARPAEAVHEPRPAPNDNRQSRIPIAASRKSRRNNRVRTEARVTQKLYSGPLAGLAALAGLSNEGLSGDIEQIIDVVRKYATSILENVTTPAPLDAAFSSLSSSLPASAFGVDHPVEWALVVGLATVLVTIPLPGSERAKIGSDEDVLPTRYDPEGIAAYFERRPLAIFKRALQIFERVGPLAAGLLSDRATGRWEANMPKRAETLLGIIADIGPTAIKLGQALSIRPDVLPEPYIAQLQKLQDKVPPFSTEQAKALLQEVLNQPVSSVFSEISAEPVAAASLGQVYRARLAGSGEEVAVKVQRPDVLESISLDQYILRKAVFAAVKLGLLADASILEVLDAFAVKYFEECDYLQEARSQMLFKEQMKRLPKILVPKVYPELCSRKVLVSEWVDGVKLADSTYGDTKELVTATLNCYLVQLLETGFLHADPHPGNMIRVHATGQLCLLDYGNMGQVTEDQRFALVEYIGHLINQDWDKVADDVVTLGFVPRDFVDQHRQMVVDILQAILGQLMAGGGAAGVDFTKFGADVDKLGSEVPLRLPGWYTIVLRAFGTLEGIGLAQDPNYSITYETFPYMAKRLLTDDHPRVRAALRYALYKDGDQLDVDRLEELAGYFTKFQSASEVLMGTGATSAVTAPGAGAAAPPSSTPAPSQSAVNGSTGGNGNGNDLGPSNANPSGLLPVSAAMSASSGAPLLDPATREVLQLTFSQEGNYVQEILVDELVRAVDALSREARAELWRSIATAAISVTTGGRSGSKSSTGVAGPLLTPLLSGLAVTAVAPWLPLAVGQGILPKGDKGEWPILLPGLLLSNGRVARGSLTEEDRKSLDVLQRLWKLVQPQLVQQTGVAAARPLAVSELREARRVAGELLPLMQALLPGLSLMGVRFLTKLVQRQLERLQEDIDRSFTPSAPQ